MRNVRLRQPQNLSFEQLQNKVGFDEARLILLQMERENGIVPELMGSWSYEDRWSRLLQAESNRTATRQ
jgi:hypothetical protein